MEGERKRKARKAKALRAGDRVVYGQGTPKEITFAFSEGVGGLVVEVTAAGSSHSFHVGGMLALDRKGDAGGVEYYEPIPAGWIH